MATKDKKPAASTAPKAPRKSREPVPANESKADKFKRLAGKRVNKALNGIRGIGNLGGGGYESTAEQREKIEKALNDALAVALDQLNRAKSASEPGFTL
jgi:hypothetical protein